LQAKRGGPPRLPQRDHCAAAVLLPDCALLRFAALCCALLRRGQGWL